MTRRIVLCTTLAALTLAVPAHAGKAAWDDASTIARDALVGAAIGIPVLKGDWTGGLQAGASIIIAGGVNYGLKEAFPETRPDGSDRKSFPSGHTAVAFAAAATLEKRYGWQAGLPAFAVATFVGVARVQADRHHWYDVVAGAAVGTASGFLFTRKHDQTVQFLPWADSQGGGFNVEMRF